MVLSTSRPPPGPPPAVVARVVRQALDEDLGIGLGGPEGDLTSDNLVPEGAAARGRLIAREPGVLAGLDVFLSVFTTCDPAARVEAQACDGQRVEPDQTVATIEGRARALLLAERTALNLLQRLSGIATRTAGFVALVEGAGAARLLDTRKTTPGLRALEKYAVLCGGGDNHRSGLYDEAMIKENHLALAGRPVADAVRAMRASIGPAVRMTCEATTDAEALAAVEGGADVILLDNMSPEHMTALVPLLRARATELGIAVELEASGGITESNLRAVAASGVDRISIGALTHSVRALDFSLYLEPA
ncbi:MAG: carboxylating nicotinate-nucleotide diphosphorylase [Planctomycetota bacterium]|nr:carboxylating nicotinate-nucleotide diphosphorylase [Planctomycetota bacterium]